jgi:hypothetical protein
LTDRLIIETAVLVKAGALDLDQMVVVLVGAATPAQGRVDQLFLHIVSDGSQRDSRAKRQLFGRVFALRRHRDKLTQTVDIATVN